MSGPASTSTSAAGSATASPTTLWRTTGLALFGLLAAILLLYRTTLVDMVSIWERSETFAHAFLVPPIVLWLVWRRRSLLAAQAPSPTFSTLLPLAAFALAWLVGDLAKLNVVTQFSMTAMLVLATVGVIGLAASREIMFPLAFLFFAVPMGDVFVPQLMEWTASFTVVALRFSGIPVFREGFNFVIPSGSWSVVEACSGVRYLIASFMVGTLFAYLNYRSMRRRLAFMAVAIVVPIIANWVRAYLIVLIGHLSGNKLAVGVDHLVYGWLFFGLVILTMYWIGAKWAQPERSDAPSSAAALASASAPAPAVARRDSLAKLGLVVAAAAALAAAPLGAQRLVAGDATTQPQLAAPTTLSAGWAAAPGNSIEWKPGFVGPSAEFDRVYSSDGRSVGLYVGYYRQQDQNRKLVASTNVLVKSDDVAWTVAPDTTRVIDVGGKPMTLRTVTLHSRSDGRGDLLVWRTYWVNGRFTSSDFVARAEIALGKLMGRGDDAAVVVVYAPASGGEPALEDFVAANLAPIERLLQITRGARP